MCGRYDLFEGTRKIAGRFEVQEILFEPEADYNISPTQTIAVITNEDGVRKLEGHRWGLIPSWAPEILKVSTFNARAETVHEKPTYRNALVRRRCLIPANGFFEWRKEGKTKQKMHILMRDEEMFAIPGLWDEWIQPDGTPLRSCTMITTGPNELMWSPVTASGIHDRMPAILTHELEQVWLDPEFRNIPDLLEMLEPIPAELMVAYAVANKPASNSLECIQPLAA